MKSRQAGTKGRKAPLARHAASYRGVKRVSGATRQGAISACTSRIYGERLCNGGPERYRKPFL